MFHIKGEFALRIFHTLNFKMIKHDSGIYFSYIFYNQYGNEFSREENYNICISSNYFQDI